MLGVSSVIMAITLPMYVFALAGLVYVLEGPFQGSIGWIRGRDGRKSFRRPPRDLHQQITSGSTTPTSVMLNVIL